MKNNVKGFTLLELLLVVAILSVLLTGATVGFNNWFEDSVDRKVSREMKDLQKNSEEYIELNFIDILASIPTLNDVVEINLNDMIAQGFLPENYSATNSYRQPLRVFVRNAQANSVNGEVIEVLTVSDDNGVNATAKDLDRILNVATNGGPSVGIVTDLNIGPTCCNGNIQNVNSTWSVPLSAIAGYNPNVSESTGQIAVYGRTSQKDVFTNNYLFRLNVPGSPELNKMETNLDLNGNDISGAGVIVFDSMQSQGSANISGVEASGLSSAYVLAVRDDLDLSGDLNIRAVGDDKGNLFVNGDETAGIDFDITNTINVQNATSTNGNFTSNVINTESLEASGEASFGDVGVNNTAVSANNIYSTSVEFGGSVTANNNLQASSASSVSQVQAPNLVARTVRMQGNTLNVPNNLKIEGNFPVNGNGTANGRGVLGTNEMAIGRINSCVNGCL